MHWLGGGITRAEFLEEAKLLALGGCFFADQRHLPIGDKTSRWRIRSRASDRTSD